MIKKEKILNYKSYSDPFPVIEIPNFLNEQDCRTASDVLINTEFDEFVRLNRSNIRKGSQSFKKLLKENSVFENLYNFFNNEEQYNFLVKELEKVSKNSQNNFIMKNKPNKFKEGLFKYKSSIHGKNIFLKFFNFIKSKIINRFVNYYYFDLHFSIAKKGYAMATHRDNDTRFLTFLLYFNTLDIDDGGKFEIYKKNNDFGLDVIRPDDSSVSVVKRIRPEAGKLIVFFSNPISYHNAETIKKDVTRCFCYGSFTSNKKIIWEKEIS
tara:strand:- start:450 stop:1250 length:801 start_codon:yes stop_codon:yes gene_type:complete